MDLRVPPLVQLIVQAPDDVTIVETEHVVLPGHGGDGKVAPQLSQNALKISNSGLVCIISKRTPIP